MQIYGFYHFNDVPQKPFWGRQRGSIGAETHQGEMGKEKISLHQVHLTIVTNKKRPLNSYYLDGGKKKFHGQIQLRGRRANS